MSDKDISEMSREEFIDFLIKERESSLDIGSGSRRAYYRKPEERKEPTFADKLHDARFEIVGVGTMPKGEYFWCSFCGNRAKHFVLLRRTTDDTTWKVGKWCVGKVGLEVPKKAKRVIIKREKTVYRKGEQAKDEEDEEDYFSLDEFFEDEER